MTRAEVIKTIEKVGEVVCNIEIGQMNSCPDCNDSCMYGTCKWQKKANEKLKHYEDLEEQGLLLKLPCKVGGVVYVIAQAFDMENNTTRYKVFIRHIDQIRGNKLNPVYFVTDGGDSFVPSSIGNRVFLTKEEAEAKLKELENE